MGHTQLTETSTGDKRAVRRRAFMEAGCLATKLRVVYLCGVSREGQMVLGALCCPQVPCAGSLCRRAHTDIARGCQICGCALCLAGSLRTLEVVMLQEDFKKLFSMYMR